MQIQESPRKVRQGASPGAVKEWTATPPGPVQPVTVWAGIGAVFSALTLYVLVKWVTGPEFARVPTGADQPPDWMKTVLTAGQIILPIACLGMLYAFVMRPWLRRRELTFDGLMCIGLLVVTVWDPFSAGLQTWFGYNSFLINRGSPMTELPLWLSAHGPGVGPAWPIFIIPPAYVVFLPWFIFAGTAYMRFMKRKFPNLRALGLIGVTLPVMMVADVFLEGFLFMPLGFWSYPGGWWPVLFSGTYYQLPFNDMLHVATVLTGFTALRYFVNDRGESIAERGAHRLPGGPLRQQATRVMAMIGVSFVILFAGYHVPNMFWGGANSKSWPKDVMTRSYFQNQCGERINRACPDPDVPLSRPGSGYVDWNGNYVPSK